MILRDVWEQYSDESCLYEHHTICGNIFKYFNIEYVKWLEGKVTKLQERSDNKDYAKCYSEIIHIINTMAYPEASIKSVLKKHFA